MKQLDVCMRELEKRWGVTCSLKVMACPQAAAHSLPQWDRGENHKE